MNRCLYCGRRIWFWQSAGWYVASPTWIERWHGACRRSAIR